MSKSVCFRFLKSRQIFAQANDQVDTAGRLLRHSWREKILWRAITYTGTLGRKSVKIRSLGQLEFRTGRTGPCHDEASKIDEQSGKFGKNDRNFA
jgi:hypothetical protein